MTLPSGTISLDQIHGEVLGTSGTTCSINDSDIRGLIDKTSAATMSFSEWRGAQRVLDTQTINVGSWSNNPYYLNGRGYLQNAAYYYYEAHGWSGGTIDDGTSNFLNLDDINLLYHFGIPQAGVITESYLYFSVSGTHAQNAFTTMNVNDHDWASADAVFTTGTVNDAITGQTGASDFGEDNSTWVWFRDTGFTDNPFTDRDTDTTVVWK